ncbi:MAG: short chain dehydrogenase [Methanomassiliicoccales archaeon PtaU1.Bin124]|nr:MAG: short chain dehydrogenase [Methanomassiliicoccales archaeon PtaU1.Bin124]
MSTRLFMSIGIAIMTGLLVLSSFSAIIVSADAQTYQLSNTASSVKYAEVNGVSLGYREYGSGEPLLLICGFGATMDMWNATFIGILAENFHVYTYDHRGMGYSSDDSSVHTMEMYADDAVGLMHALGYQSMNIYGTSMGSIISQQIMIDHNGSVRKAALSSASYSVRIPECALLLATLESVVGNTSYSLGIREEAAANLAWGGAWDGLAGIKNPVLLIVGTNDLLTPDSVSVQIAGQISASWLVRFTGILHSGQSYAPVQYANSVTYFLLTNETPVFSPIPPSAPTSVVAALHNEQILISWNASVSNGGSAITGYILFRGSELIASLNATTLSYIDPDLASGTAYTYYVVATNSAGSSAISMPVTATTHGQNANITNLMLAIAAVVIAVVLTALVMSRKKK